MLVFMSRDGVPITTSKIVGEVMGVSPLDVLCAVDKMTTDDYVRLGVVTSQYEAEDHITYPAMLFPRDAFLLVHRLLGGTEHSRKIFLEAYNEAEQSR